MPRKCRSKLVKRHNFNLEFNFYPSVSWKNLCQLKRPEKFETHTNKQDVLNWRFGLKGLDEYDVKLNIEYGSMEVTSKYGNS